MKRLISVFFVLIICVCSIAFIGCKKCEHTFESNWSKNEYFHWRESTCGCNVVKGKSQHNFDGNRCLTCDQGLVATDGIIIDEYNRIAGIEDKNVKNIVLPRSYRGSLITEIKGGAFSGCTKLESININDSFTAIGASAFSGCTSLKSVIIPSTVTNFGEGIFFGCTALTDVTFKGNFSSIVKTMFSGCSSLKQIIIPDGVSTISEQAFANCTALESIIIPDSVNKIDDGAFYNCSSLKNVHIGSGVSSIGVGAFNRCNAIQNIEFEVTNGWRAGNDSISQLWFTDSSRLKGLLTNTYANKVWTRS